MGRPSMLRETVVNDKRERQCRHTAQPWSNMGVRGVANQQAIDHLRSQHGGLPLRKR